MNFKINSRGKITLKEFLDSKELLFIHTFEEWQSGNIEFAFDQIFLKKNHNGNRYDIDGIGYDYFGPTVCYSNKGDIVGEYMISSEYKIYEYEDLKEPLAALFSNSPFEYDRRDFSFRKKGVLSKYVDDFYKRLEEIEKNEKRI